MQPRKRGIMNSVSPEAGAAPVVPAANSAPPLDDRVGRLARAFGWAALWQALGKLIGVIGLSYAYRCLGSENVGVSGTVLATVMILQVVLDFGLEIVAVRHVAAGTVRLADLTPALFTLRVVQAAAMVLAGAVLVPWMPLPAPVRWVWWWGVVHLAFLTASFSWFYQATDRMPWFSLLQNATNVATSLVFLVAFRPGQRLGSDLVVTLALNALLTAGVWVWIQRQVGRGLFRPAALPLALRLFREARPTWVFNLLYTALVNLNLPLCAALLGDRAAGHFRSAAMLVAAVQTFLTYFALVLNPRIVHWRHAGPGVLRRRLLALTTALAGTAGLCLGALWLVREPVVRLLWGADFLPAATVLPQLMAAKFLAVASGLLVWGLFAHYREWLAVACVAPCVAVALVFNLWLVPRHGLAAAGWLYFGAELLLLALTFWALNRVELARTRAA
jgi:O-antigen/teichoic acid export membrane protein